VPHVGKAALNEELLLFYSNALHKVEAVVLDRCGRAMRGDNKVGSILDCIQWSSAEVDLRAM
jgi:hypothetical protein